MAREGQNGASEVYCDVVIAARVERATFSLGRNCSIQLSYATKKNKLAKIKSILKADYCQAMLKSLPVRIISLITLILLGFFFLVNNINYLKSILSQENSDLANSKQQLENKLQTRTNKNSTDLSLFIEKQIGLGNIEFSSGTAAINIATLRKPTVTNVIPDRSSTTSEKPVNDGNSAIISR